MKIEWTKGTRTDYMEEIQPGLKILARFAQNGLGFEAGNNMAAARKQKRFQWN